MAARISLSDVNSLAMAARLVYRPNGHDHFCSAAWSRMDGESTAKHSEALPNGDQPRGPFRPPGQDLGRIETDTIVPDRAFHHIGDIAYANSYMVGLRVLHDVCEGLLDRPI